MFGFHLRITANYEVSKSEAKDELMKICKLFVEKFNPKKYIFSFEEVIESGKNNRHIHGHLEYEKLIDIPKKQTI